MTYYRCIQAKTAKLTNTSYRVKYVHNDHQTIILVGKDNTILLCRLGCLNHVSLIKITKLRPTQMYLRVYKRRKSALRSPLKMYANSSAHTLLFYSVAKVKFVNEKLWFVKVKFRK